MKEKRRSSEFNSKAKQSYGVSCRALYSQPLTLRHLPVGYTEQGLLFYTHSQLEERDRKSRKHKSHPNGGQKGNGKQELMTMSLLSLYRGFIQ